MLYKKKKILGSEMIHFLCISMHILDNMIVPGHLG